MINATKARPTEQDVLGPYWVPGAPVRTDGVITDELGTDPKDGMLTKVILRGTVSDENGQPIAGAQMDFWQASPPHPDNGLGYYDTTTFNYRGKVVADDKGQYQAQTVIPGHYPLNGFGPDGHTPEQGVNRPEHIHLMVVGPNDKVGSQQDPQGGVFRPIFDSANQYKGLVTQIYFKDDGDVDTDEQATDEFYQENDGASRAVALDSKLEEGFKIASGTLDVTLQKA